VRESTNSIPVILIVAGFILFVWFNRTGVTPWAYERIELGMSEEEVEAILGPGTPISSWTAAKERGFYSGNSIGGKPIEVGDYSLRWENRNTGECILLAFKDGKVCHKVFGDPYRSLQ
jgi:hypothetical protein